MERLREHVRLHFTATPPLYGIPRTTEAVLAHPAFQQTPVTRFSREGESLVPQLAHDPAGTGRLAHLAYPTRANSPLRLEDAATGLAITTRLLEAGASTAEVADGFVAYRGAFRGGDVVHRAQAEGTEDYVWFEAAPPKEEVTYEVALDKHVAGLRLVGNTLEFVDASGDPRLRIDPPYLLDQTGARHDVTIGVAGCAVDTSPLPPWNRAVVAPGAGHCAVHLTWEHLGADAYPALLDPAWVTTGSMAAARGEHQATRLAASGLVLVSGGAVNGANPTSGCELYNPASGTWSATGSMKQARYGHTLTVLQDGRVFVSGGGTSGTAMGTGEIYNPSNGQWGYVAGGNSMNRNRIYHSAALQPSTGRVLITGGYTGSFVSKHSEAYFTDTDSWKDLSDENTSRERHGSAFVNGVPVIFGGDNGVSKLNSVEYLDLSNTTWHNASSGMNAARASFPFVQQGDGTIVVAGGDSSSGQTNGFEVMATNLAWYALAGMPSARSGLTLNEFNNGVFFAAGGASGSTNVATSETWNPATNAWTFAANLNVARSKHTATIIGDGLVLAAGGYVAGGTTNTAEVIRIPITCSSNGTCWSGQCVDGYCCNTACNGGQCDRCNLPGVEGLCTLVPSGGDGSPSCAPYTCSGTLAQCPTSCTADSQCITGDICYNNQCVPKLSNGTACTQSTQCQSGNCVDSVCCNSACNNACDVCSAALGASANGTCSPAPATSGGSPSCGAYLCNGSSTSCPTSCTADTQCISGDACVQGKCVTKVSQGGSCVANNQCTTGHCVDGFCCDQTCSGGCDVCAASLGASQNGTCTAVAPGNPGANPTCAPYLCGGSGSCPTSCSTDTDCTSTSYCDASRHCVPKQANGASCTAVDQCASGNCVDGFCCNTACGNACDVCAASLGATANGTCSPAAIGTPGTPSCGTYLCDGVNASCPTQCSTDAVCGPSTYCSNSTCVPVLSTGSACGSGRQCVTGYCADGFCCNAPCDGSCDVCSQALGATMNGSCTAVAKGQPGAPTCDPFVCDGVHGSCPTTCTVDGDCASEDYCANGTCTPKKALGTTCGSARECGSTMCVDGVCCSSQCSGACAACNIPGSAGTCSPVPAGSAGLPACGDYVCNGTSKGCPTTCTSDASCSAANYCDASNHCVPKFPTGKACTAANECASGNCVDGVCCNSACADGCDVCAKALGADVDGDCTPAPAGVAGNPLCTPYLCDGHSGACPTACTSDASCVAGDFCDTTGHCVPKQQPGATCTGTNQCASGFCVSGVCCNSACTDACATCDAAPSHPAGTCGPAATGTAAASCGQYLCDGNTTSCPATCSSDSNCLASDFCDAMHHCVPKHPNGTSCAATDQCASGFCVDGFCCDSACDGSCDVCARTLGATVNGTCTPVAGVAGTPVCTPYLCDGKQAACPTSCTSDAMCVAGDFCNASGQCVPKQPNGATCSATSQCTSGFCVDGVCCNTSCTDQCAACNVAPNVGTCSPAPAGAPVGMRPACVTDGTACGGQCDGHTTAACAFPGSATTCGAASCQGADSFPPPTCSGHGSCQPGQPLHCDPYTCGMGGCLTECGSDADCTMGHFCSNGVCVMPLPQGTTCDRNAQCLTGNCVDGFCCDTACEGACAQCNAPNHEGTCTPLPSGVAPENGDCAPLLCDGASESCPLLCQTTTDCAMGFTCINGRCTAPKPQGAECQEAADCGSGFCVDGVCCDTACDGSCESCGLPDHLGSCTLTTGAPPPGHPNCGEGVCGGTCDGQQAACTFPPQDTVCSPAFCSEATATAASLCNGKGQCVAGEQSACVLGCAGDHCAALPRMVPGGCASAEPGSLGLLGGLLILTGLRRRKGTSAPRA